MVSDTSEKFVEARLRVRYAETDQMGVAYYGNYFAWFEVGRTEYCRAQGFSYAELERKTQTYLPVVEARCLYRKPLQYDTELLVRTRVKEFRRRFVSFSYELFSSDGAILHAEGETRHVFTDQHGKPKSLPKEYHAYFPREAGARQVASGGCSDQ